jgi:hypothetical protein
MIRCSTCDKSIAVGSVQEHALDCFQSPSSPQQPSQIMKNNAETDDALLALKKLIQYNSPRAHAANARSPGSSWREMQSFFNVEPSNDCTNDLSLPSAPPSAPPPLPPPLSIATVQLPKAAAAAAAAAAANQRVSAAKPRNERMKYHIPANDGTNNSSSRIGANAMQEWPQQRAQSDNPLPMFASLGLCSGRVSQTGCAGCTTSAMAGAGIRTRAVRKDVWEKTSPAASEEAPAAAATRVQVGRRGDGAKQLEEKKSQKKEDGLWPSVAALALAAFQTRLLRGSRDDAGADASDGDGDGAGDDSNNHNTANQATWDSPGRNTCVVTASSRPSTGSSSTGSATCNAFASATSPWRGAVNPRSPYSNAPNRVLFAQ